MAARKRQRVHVEGKGEVDLHNKQIFWQSDLTHMPVISLPDTYAYLLSEGRWTVDRVIRYSEDDGYLMFKTGHTENVVLGIIKDHPQHCYIKSELKPEERQKADRYPTWLLVSSTGVIVSAGCGCVA